MCLDLLVSGCDPTLVDRHGDTPLHIACRHGNLLCFSVITQNCRSEHLCGMMGACNYQGEDRKSLLLLVLGQAGFCLNRCGSISDRSMTMQPGRGHCSLRTRHRYIGRICNSASRQGDARAASKNPERKRGILVARGDRFRLKPSSSLGFYYKVKFVSLLSCLP